MDSDNEDYNEYQDDEDNVEEPAAVVAYVFAPPKPPLARSLAAVEAFSRSLCRTKGKRVKQRRGKKDPEKPKGAMSAYMVGRSVDARAMLISAH